MSTDPRPYVILVALDVVGDSPGALSRAIELARAHPRTEIHVLAVVPAFSGVAVPNAGAFVGDSMKEALRSLRDFATVQLEEAEARATFPAGTGPQVQVHATIGAPAAEIVWLAAHVDADLVVVATHSRKGLRRLLLGSVAERVSRLAGCPVLVVRDKHHHAPWRIPEIEPTCEECATTRAETKGAALWCARHAEHHLRAHVPCQSPHERGPSAIESATGT